MKRLGEKKFKEVSTKELTKVVSRFNDFINAEPAAFKEFVASPGIRSKIEILALYLNLKE